MDDRNYPRLGNKFWQVLKENMYDNCLKSITQHNRQIVRQGLRSHLLSEKATYLLGNDAVDDPLNWEKVPVTEMTEF